MAEAMQAKHVTRITADQRGFTKVTLDGRELENIEELHFRARAGRVEVELTMTHLDVEIETEVGEPKVVKTETTSTYEADWRAAR